MEDDKSTASYDIATGIFTIMITKETPGEHFEDLDLLTKLLARKGEQTAQTAPKKPLIEVLSSSTDQPDIIQEGNTSENVHFCNMTVNNPLRQFTL